MASDAPITDDLAARLIDVKVLTQLPDPHATIHFHSLLAGTSVQELKARIQQVIPVHPPLETFRFIHQGRVLARDADSLVDVFGRDNVSQPTTHTLHLVIREQQPTTSRPLVRDQPSISAPNPALAQAPGPAARVVPNVPFPAGGNVQFPQLAAGAQVQHLQNYGPFAHAHVPVPMQQTPFAALHAAPHHLAPQLAQQPGGAAHAIQGLPDLNAIIQQQIQQAIAASRPNIRADNTPAPRQGVDPTMDQNRQGTSVHAERETPANANATSSQNEADSATSETRPEMISTGGEDPNSSRPVVQQDSITRHGVGPNGERWTITTNTSSNAFAPQPGLSAISHHQFAPSGSNLVQNLSGQHNNANMVSFRTQSPAQVAGTDPSRGGHLANILPYPGWLGPAHAIDYLQNLQSQFESALQTCRMRYPAEGHHSRPHAVNSGLMIMRTYVAQRNRVQQTVNHVLAYGPPIGHTNLTTQQIATLQSLNDRFQTIVRDWASDFVRPDAPGIEALNTISSHQEVSVPDQTETAIAGPDQPNPSVNPASGSPGGISNQVTAYLLRSPQGPQAIVYSHEGVFTNSNRHRTRFYSQSPDQPGSSVAASQSQVVARDQDQPVQARNAGVNQNGRYLVLPDRIQGNPNHEPFVQQLHQQLRQDQQRRRGVALNLTPFFQALWLFIRGYAFMWLFLGGRGTGGGIFSWRSFLLFILSLAYWAIQVGVGARQIMIVRRYWNDLIGPRPQPRQEEQGLVDGQEQRPTDTTIAEMQPNGQNIEPGQQQHSQGEPRREAANTRAQDGSLREWLRPFERTVALFLASLYPGVGERHVAERDRARREAEERDRARAAAAAATNTSAVEADMATQQSEQTPMHGQRTSGDRLAAPCAQATHSSPTDNVSGQGLSNPEPGKEEVARGSALSSEGNSTSVAGREGQEGLSQRTRNNEVS